MNDDLMVMVRNSAFGTQRSAFGSQQSGPLPASSMKLPVVRGKGGVGKTTLACAPGAALGGGVERGRRFCSFHRPGAFAGCLPGP